MAARLRRLARYVGHMAWNHVPVEFDDVPVSLSLPAFDLLRERGGAVYVWREKDLLHVGLTRPATFETFRCARQHGVECWLAESVLVTIPEGVRLEIKRLGLSGGRLIVTNGMLRG